MKFKSVDTDKVDIDYLREEFNRFRNELSGMKDKLGDNASGVLDQMAGYLNRGNLSSRIANLESELEQLGGRLKGTGKNAVTRIEAEVTERPITSLAIAFGIGLLTAQFFRRS